MNEIFKTGKCRRKIHRQSKGEKKEREGDCLQTVYGKIALPGNWKIRPPRCIENKDEIKIQIFLVGPFPTENTFHLNFFN